MQVNSTTAQPAAAQLPAPELPAWHSANYVAALDLGADPWAARQAEIAALAAELVEAGYSAEGAARYAAALVDGLAEYAARYDAERDAERRAVEALPAPARRALGRARVALAEGARTRWAGAALLVESASRPGIWHRAEAGRCDCEAGQHGRCCWHRAARYLLAGARPAALDRLAA